MTIQKEVTTMTMLSCRKVLRLMRVCQTRMIRTTTSRCLLAHRHQDICLRCPKAGNLFFILHILIVFTRRPTATTTHIYGYPNRCSTSPNGTPCGIGWPTIPTPTTWFCCYPPTTSRFCDSGANPYESPTRCYPWSANGLASVPTQSSTSTSAPGQLSGPTTQPTIPRTPSWSLRSYDSLSPSNAPTTTTTVYVESSPTSTSPSSAPVCCSTTTVADQHHSGHFSRTRT